MSLSQPNPIMRETFINKLEKAWGVLIYGELFYVCTDWEMEDGESCFAFIAQMEDENSDRFYIPYSKEESLKVTYNAITSEWKIENMDIPPFQILKVDTL